MITAVEPDLSRPQSSRWREAGMTDSTVGKPDELDPLDVMISAMHADSQEIDTNVNRAFHARKGKQGVLVNHDPDQYDWLKVPTKHSFLRKLLRTKLVELFSERGMSSKFEKLVYNFKKSVQSSEAIGTATANHKVAEDFFGLKLPGEEAPEGPEGLTFNKKVKRFKPNNKLLEETIIVVHA